MPPSPRGGSEGDETYSIAVRSRPAGALSGFAMGQRNHMTLCAMLATSLTSQNRKPPAQNLRTTTMVLSAEKSGPQPCLNSRCMPQCVSGACIALSVVSCVPKSTSPCGLPELLRIAAERLSTSPDRGVRLNC